jgi:hypothetical protein
MFNFMKKKKSQPPPSYEESEKETKTLSNKCICNINANTCKLIKHNCICTKNNIRLCRKKGCHNHFSKNKYCICNHCLKKKCYCEYFINNEINHICIYDCHECICNKYPKKCLRGRNYFQKNHDCICENNIANCRADYHRYLKKECVLL